MGDRERLLALGRDLSRAWDSAGASTETRKKIVRLLIAEIIVDVVGDTLALVIHWQGGDHTRLSAKRNKVGQNRWVTETDVVDLVRILARQMPDEAIAAVLNRSEKSTGRGNSWTRMRVSSLRHNRDIAPYREGERSERGEVTVNEAAAALAVSPSTIRRMISHGMLPGQHHAKAHLGSSAYTILIAKTCVSKQSVGARDVRYLVTRSREVLIYKEIASWAARNAFPKWQEGRHPHCHFRGLLRLHLRYGPPDRSAAQRRPLSRGSSPCGCPHEPLVSYRINRQLYGWNLPPLMIRAFGAHCHEPTYAVQQILSLRRMCSTSA